MQVELAYLCSYFDEVANRSYWRRIFEGGKGCCGRSLSQKKVRRRNRLAKSSRVTFNASIVQFCGCKIWIQVDLQQKVSSTLELVHCWGSTSLTSTWNEKGILLLMWSIRIRINLKILLPISNYGYLRSCSNQSFLQVDGVIDWRCTICIVTITMCSILHAFLHTK